jgi:hypothetical protein
MVYGTLPSTTWRKYAVIHFLLRIFYFGVEEAKALIYIIMSVTSFNNEFS